MIWVVAGVFGAWCAVAAALAVAIGKSIAQADHDRLRPAAATEDDLPEAVGV